MGSSEDDGQARSATQTLARDLMFGFGGVKDDDERQYLADLIIDGVGDAEDIDELLQLSLFQGVEQWDQAICCGKSLQKRDPSSDLLGGNDALTFLAKVYGLSSPISDTKAQNASPRPVRKKSDCIGNDATPTLGRSLITRVKKAPRAMAKSVSPYWHNTIGDATEHGGEIDSTLRRPHKPRTHLANPATPEPPVVATHTSDDPVSLQSPPSQVTNTESGDIRPVSHLETAFFRGGLACRHRASGISARSPLPHDPMNRSSLDDSQSLFDDAETGGDPGYAVCAKRVSKSPFFHSESPLKSPRNPRPPGGVVSSIPFPRLDSPEFGLIQEELADDPFWLLIAVTFLIRTAGRTAIPVFRALMERYPTPRALAEAKSHDIHLMVRHLGLGAVRTVAIAYLYGCQQRYARRWMEDPPRNGIRYGVKNYPRLRDGADVKAGEVLEIGDTRASAWEIGHGITNGPYAIDSWRIFCRDVLRGEASDWNGRGREGKFQPEWMRVLPQDKELRACLRWKWMQEGWEWDPTTGEKEVLSADTYRAVQEGRVGYDDTGGLKILTRAA
ncbi:DNA glycosylase [Xylariaceae sp. FL1019]|nr:DNA glycosylase [Xylariaceae sp. FL1019]